MTKEEQLAVTYPVHERFYTFQGEGVHMGRPAFFIRLFGCPLHCPWCDSAGTWHPEYVPKTIHKMSVKELVGEVKESGAGIVVITGGEPAIHNLVALCMHLRNIFTDSGDYVRVHLETSGAFDLRGMFDWITVSPKRAKPPTALCVDLADEFKYIIETPDDIQYWSDTLSAIHKGFVKDTAPIWLHPEWSKSKDSAVLQAITKAVKDRKFNYRAGWQLHKLYRSDLLDNRAAPAAPLGGNPQLGF